MKRIILLLISVCAFTTNIASADTFAEGTANEFDIDFVSISGSTNPASGYGIVNNDYRMGAYEITNEQWDKFRAEYGSVAGNPLDAYDNTSYWNDADIPTTGVSWFEAAQFVNYLNTSTGHQSAYKFTGTQGTSDYTFVAWNVTDAGYDASNPFRNSNAFYFLPTEDEWYKAAYWNGTDLQTWATVNNEIPIEGVDTNYNNAIGDPSPWATTAGSVELNGTKNMMGNVREWMESPYLSGDFSDFYRGVRGGTYSTGVYGISSAYRYDLYPDIEINNVGFRVASVPEPTSFILLCLGGLLLRKRKV